MQYRVKLDLFEGPFELLIYLIEHARMSVYDIQIAEITSQYLAYVAALRKEDPDSAQEFMVLAAELIEIKSRMLLPAAPAQEAGDEPEDPRAALTDRLLEYKKVQAAARKLEELQQQAGRSYAKPQEDLSLWTREPDELLKADMAQFVRAFSAFLLKRQKLDEMKKNYSRIERERRTVELRMAEIASLFGERRELFFSELLQNDDSADNAVLSFLSVLEMLRQGDISAEQQGTYADIMLRRRS